MKQWRIEHEQARLSALNNEYSDHCYRASVTDGLTQMSRTEYGLKELEKYVNAHRRSLIGKAEYNIVRNTIEKFIFNK